MKRGRAIAALTAWLALVSSTSCAGEQAPPRDQWVIAMTTDAPASPFFDRLLVEILSDSGDLACGTACRRVFGLSGETRFPIEIGVTASAAPTHVRARLYRSDHVGPDGLPVPPMMLDAFGRLPPAMGVTKVGLELRMACFGLPSSPTEKTTCVGEGGSVDVEPTLGPPRDPPLVFGSWAPAAKVECRGVVPQGMICVPGGALFLGAHFSSVAILGAAPEHLVQVSPFAIDADEMTVGVVRELVLSGRLDASPRERDVNPFAADYACTWLGTGSPANDSMPLNCVGYELADAACKALGKRLPTEVELEWAAGNTVAETEYPWGGDPDVCAHAIVGRGRTVGEVDDSAEFSGCRDRIGGILPWGPVAGGSPRDVTTLGVRNLAGNVSEWAADRFFSSYDDPCWGPTTVLQVDPRCDAPARVTSSHVSRGGSWMVPEIIARVVGRYAQTPEVTRPGASSPAIGFRCATSM